VSDLRNEILLRLGKLLLTAVIGAAFYIVAVGLGATPGPELGLLAWVSGGIAVLIFQSPPL
jgi:hypothetical protein